MKKIITLIAVVFSLLISSTLIAETYYPSPTSKDTVVGNLDPKIVDSKGEEISGYSYNEETRIATITDSKTGTTEEYEIVYTPFEKVDEMEVTKINNLLKDSNSDLTNDSSKTLKEILNEEIKVISKTNDDYKNKTEEDLSVVRLFDVSVLKITVDTSNRTDSTRSYITLEDYFKIIQEKTGTLPSTYTFTLKTNLPDTFILCHDRSADNVGDWELVPEKSNATGNNYYTYKDGVLTITTTSLSCYAVFATSNGSGSDIIVPDTSVK